MSYDHIQVLNLAKEGKWDEAHQLVQAYSDKYSCLIHGYLHRIEGDLSNANYWYQRAGEEMPDNLLDVEMNRLYALLTAR